MLRWWQVSRIFRCTCNRILRSVYFGKSVHNEPSKMMYLFFFDHWTVFSSLIQFIYELAPRSLWSFSVLKRSQWSVVSPITRVVTSYIQESAKIRKKAGVWREFMPCLTLPQKIILTLEELLSRDIVSISYNYSHILMKYAVLREFKI